MRDLKEQLAENPVDDNDDIEVEVIDDRPPEDQREPADLENLDESDFELTKEEVEALSEKAQKRIKQLVWKANEERRQREQALRERQEALDHAKRMQTMSQQQVREYQKALLERQKALVGHSVQQAQAELAIAHEDADPQKIAKAQAKLTQALMQQGQSEQMSQYYAHQFGQAQEQSQNGDQRPAQPTHQQQPVETPEPSDVTKKWMQANPWFNTDQVMTSTAVGVHQHLIMNEGIEPDTPEYFARIDREMRRRFPEHFAGESGRSQQAETVTVDTQSESEVRGHIAPRPRTRTPVAPTRGRSGSSASSGGKVQLTRTEVATAKALGVSLVEYARQKRELERTNG